MPSKRSGSLWLLSSHLRIKQCIRFDLALLSVQIHTEKLSEVWELIALESFRSVQQIWQIEIGNVVTDDDVRIHLSNEISPCLQHLFFVVIFQDLRSDDMGAGIQCENVPDERLALSLSGDHVCDLDHRVDVGLWEDTFSSSALNIETKNSQWGNVCAFSFRGMRDKFVVAADRGH